jgi:hypothetical protein
MCPYSTSRDAAIVASGVLVRHYGAWVDCACTRTPVLPGLKQTQGQGRDQGQEQQVEQPSLALAVTVWEEGLRDCIGSVR